MAMWWSSTELDRFLSASLCFSSEINIVFTVTIQQQSMYLNRSLERRPVIEIFPIQSQSTQSLKTSSINYTTISPINSTSKNSSSAGASSDKRTGANNGNEHSSSSSSSKRSESLSSESVRLKLEKKKKRKREDCPMGPPEKMPGNCRFFPIISIVLWLFVYLWHDGHETGCFFLYLIF